MVVRQTTIAFAIYGPIARDDLPGLCDRVCALLSAERPGIAFCDVRGVEPDAVTVDALADSSSRRGAAGARFGSATRRPSCSSSSSSWACAMSYPSELGGDSRGTPNSGNTRAVSRKNVNSTIFPSSISSTWSAQGS